LKIDVEGNELKVMQGAQEMIKADKVDYIQFEFGGFGCCNTASGTCFYDFFRFLNESYRVYRILKNDLWEIRSYRAEYECLVTTNYLAERRNILQL
jgi:hypothetical protein